MKEITFLIAILCSACVASASSAGVVYESGPLGPTGIRFQELLDQTVPGTNVSDEVFVGARFEIDTPVITSRIGGHFVGHPLNPSQEFFGTIIKLSDAADMPNSDDLISDDVLGVTHLTFPVSSNEVFGLLSVPLDPGHYAVVFGSGLFGTSAVGGAVRSGITNDQQSYFGWQPGSTGWHDLSDFFSGHRFVVEGTFIPEPTSLVLFACGTSVLTCRRRQAGGFTGSSREGCKAHRIRNLTRESLCRDHG